MQVLIVDELHSIIVHELKKMGWKCDDRPTISPNEIRDVIANYEGIILRTKIKINKEIIDAAPNLKFIARAGAGMENIDVEYANSKGIACFNSPEGNSTAVAEHAVGMLLSLLNNLNKADKEVRSGKWNRKSNWGIQLAGKTIGIVGYGNMGSAFAERLLGFGVYILAYDKYKIGFAKQGMKESTLEEIFENVDILSLHIPLTKETAYWLNDTVIKQFKKNFFLINTSRGKVVQTTHLAAAIQSGKIIGACLDVLEDEGENFEKLDFALNEKSNADLHYLLNSDKVIFSPHIAGWTHEAYESHSKVLAEKVKKWSLNRI